MNNEIKLRVRMRIYDEETGDIYAMSDEPLYHDEDEIARQAYRMQEQANKKVQRGI